jgi:hypothetical protein
MRPIRTLALLALLATAAVPDSAPGARSTALAADGAARPGALRIERLAGEPVTGSRIVSLDGRKVVVETTGAPAEIPLDDVVEIALAAAPDPARPYGPLEVAADLWTGETVLGEFRGGDGENVEIDAALLGRVKIAIEGLSTLRFLQRVAQAAEPPDLRPRADADVVHLAGGDSFVGTVEGFGAKSLRAVTAQKDRVDVPVEKLVAVCLLADPQRKAAPAEGTLRLALRDGTRVLGREPRLEGVRLKMRSPSGFDVDCALADVVAVQSASARFAFLSDLPAARVEVKPLWEVAAGDPALLFAPQLDRSFSGKPLRCGGRTWLDGIGVFSGTTMTWELGGRYREFRASAGIDDGAGPLGGVVFQVLVDGREVWNSGFVVPSAGGARGTASPVTTPRIPLEGAKTLSLVVLAGDADDPYPVQDEADWLGAIVVRAEK